MRISDWSSDVCSSDLDLRRLGGRRGNRGAASSCRRGWAGMMVARPGARRSPHRRFRTGWRCWRMMRMALKLGYVSVRGPGQSDRLLAAVVEPLEYRGVALAGRGEPDEKRRVEGKRWV